MERCQGVEGNCRHQQNSSISKIWQLVEQRQNQENFATWPPVQKLGRTKEKEKAPGCGKQEFATNAIWRQDSKF
jgi:hypothetical protein